MQLDRSRRARDGWRWLRAREAQQAVRLRSDGSRAERAGFGNAAPDRRQWHHPDHHDRGESRLFIVSGSLLVLTSSLRGLFIVEEPIDAAIFERLFIIAAPQVDRLLFGRPKLARFAAPSPWRPLMRR